MKIFSFKKNLFNCLIFFSVFAIADIDLAFGQEKNESWYIKNAPFKMPEVIVPTFADHTFPITKYGAVSDGQTLNTTAFEKAINECSAAGGGRVVVPTGLWLTGPIQLKSNVDLHTERGALIIFTKDHSQYPMIKASNTSSTIVPASPIYGYDLKNIAITGDGIFDGAGDSWRPVKKGKTTDAQWKDLIKTGVVDKDIWWPNKEAMDGESFLKSLKEKNAKPSADDYLPARDFLRPYMLYLINCQNILIEDVTLRNSPKFVFYPNTCTNLTMRYATIFNEWWAQNGDGIDISACKNVMIYKCTVSAGDDGICMKSSSGKNDDKNNANLENIIVAGCNVYHAHGGFVIGSNTDGGMQNIFVNDCNFIGTDVGIRVKSNAGRGGLVHNIFISNIFMSDIANEAILFDTYYEDVPAGTAKATTVPRDKTPDFMDFHISNVFCNGAKTAIAITGLPEMPVHKIYFDNISISAQNGLVATDAADLNLNKVKIITIKDPVFTLNSVKNINISEGYFPASSKIFIKGDNKTSGVKVTATDLRNVSSAIQVSNN